MRNTLLSRRDAEEAEEEEDYDSRDPEWWLRGIGGWCETPLRGVNIDTLQIWLRWINLNNHSCLADLGPLKQDTTLHNVVHFPLLKLEQRRVGKRIGVQVISLG
ncbi:unnamed protein product [Merluccius merluccius]